MKYGTGWHQCHNTLMHAVPYSPTYRWPGSLGPTSSSALGNANVLDYATATKAKKQTSRYTDKLCMERSLMAEQQKAQGSTNMNLTCSQTF